MDNSQDQANVEAVAALLLAGEPLAGGRVFEGRDLVLGLDVASQIHVFLDDSEPNGELIYTGAPIDWDSEISIVIRARRDAASGYSAEKVADSLLVEAYARVMADQSLGGRVQQLTVGAISRDRDRTDPNVAAFTWRFTVAHRTTQHSLLPLV